MTRSRRDVFSFVLTAIAAIVSVPSHASTDYQVVIGLAGEQELHIVPDPMVIGRDRPGGADWRLDAGARQAARMVEVRFETGSPFIEATASASADTLITLGPLRYPPDLGSYNYAIRLLDAEGRVVGAGSGAVEIRETGGLSHRAYWIAGLVGVVLLLANYLERKPLTRSYEH